MLILPRHLLWGIRSKRHMGLRTDWGLIVLNVAEVLPMVADVLTVLSFAVLCMTKIVPVIPQIGRCANYISYSRAAMWPLFFFSKLP